MRDVASVDNRWKQFALYAKSVPSLLTVEECNAVKEDALSLGIEPARVLTARTGSSQISPMRTCGSVSLPRMAEREWLYERLFKASEAVNARYWRFALDGMEDLRVLRYRSFQFFRWHYDVFPGSSRKVTCVVNLSSPKSYWRGGLEINGWQAGEKEAHLQGAATWLPGYLRHRAKAPWLGERWVLVAWLTGPAWV